MYRLTGFLVVGFFFLTRTQLQLLFADTATLGFFLFRAAFTVASAETIINNYTLLRKRLSIFITLSKVNRF